MTFSPFKLLLRNLRYFRAANLAILAGMTVATAVLTGALMVGDSVRGSLRDLTVRRLGTVDQAMIAPRTFPQGLADRIAADPAYKQSNFTSIVPALSLRGSAATPDGKHRSPGVQINAIDGRGLNDLSLKLKPGEAMVNSELAAALDHAVGGPLRFSIATPDVTPRNSTLARRSRNDAITTLETAKSQVTPANGLLDLFNLVGGQRTPKNAWVDLSTLQEQLDQPGQVNMLWVSERGGISNPEDAARLNQIVRNVATLADYGLSTVKSGDRSEVAIVSDSTFLNPAVVEAADKLAAEEKIPVRKVSAYLINAVVKFDPNRDTPAPRRPSGFWGGPGSWRPGSTRPTGTRPSTRPASQKSPGLRSGTEGSSNQSASTQATSASSDTRIAATQAIAAKPPATQPAATPLAATAPATRSVGGASSRPATQPGAGSAPAAGEQAQTVSTINYAIGAGISEIDGTVLKKQEIAINQWTADRMGLKAGDWVRFDYYERQRNGELAEVRSDRGDMLEWFGTAPPWFKVVKIVPMTGLGADSTLTPQYKGLTDAAAIADWRPPAGVNINKKLVTKEDEAYWDKYKAAPKIFVSLDAAQALWGQSYGDLTSVRVPTDRAEAFLAKLPHQVDPALLGMVFRPIKAQQLAATAGGTDFGMLFAGFSFFLLIAAVLLVAMLFRLSVEQRARQLGLLSACGLSPGQVRNLCLREGMFLAIVGGVLGIACALGYTALMIHGLKTWWIGAIGTTALELHIVPQTLGIGLGAGIVVAILALLYGVRKIANSAPATLLAGGLGAETWRLAKRARLSSAIIVLLTLVSAASFVAGAFGVLRVELAFLSGSGLIMLALLVRAFAKLRPRHRQVHALSLLDLAMKNATRNRARSILCIALIALASFVIVTVSSMRSTTPRDIFNRKAGTGGYALIVQTDIPLQGDLNTLDGRKLLMRQASAADPRWEHADFALMRSWAGQDVSCLNITRPDNPTILSVPPNMARQGRFTFARQILPAGDPFTLLDIERTNYTTVPVIADDETARYILKLDIGQTMTLTDGTGHQHNLKLVATLEGSMFQSELLMSEANFMRLFPTVSGFSTFLVDTEPRYVGEVQQVLNETLNDTNDQEKTDYSASIEPTEERIDAYHQVANTYLSTFQVLGSLGLVLGTIGLGVVLVRNLLERRREMALLACLGVGPDQQERLVLMENIMLLVVGLFIGAGSALVGVIPMTRLSAHRVNVPALSIALSAVLVAGLISLLLAVRFSSWRVSPAALRTE